MMMMVQTTKKANGLLQAIFVYISLKDPNSLTPLCRTKTLIVAIFGPWTHPANLLQNLDADAHAQESENQQKCLTTKQQQQMTNK